MSGVTNPLAGVRDGAVGGRAGSGIWAFSGIPRAAPRFGANRLQPPQPARAWHGERDATAYGPAAPKGNYCARGETWSVFHPDLTALA